MSVRLPRSAMAVCRAIKVFGGQVPMAFALGVSQPVISEWSTGRKPVPAEQCPRIERLTRDRGDVVTCEELRPDIEWGVLRLQAAPETQEAV